MFLDPARFSVVRQIAAQTEAMGEELDRLQPDQFVPWPQRGAFEGDWRLFPLLMFEPLFDDVVDYERNRRTCPRTWRALQQFDSVRLACFSWLGPGSHILPHTDAYHHGLIRLHFGLRVPPQSLVRAGVELRAMSPGGVMVLDGQTLHEAANLSTEPRVTLLVDVQMTEAESDYVAAASADRRRAIEKHRGDGLSASGS